MKFTSEELAFFLEELCSPEESLAIKKHLLAEPSGECAQLLEKLHASLAPLEQLATINAPEGLLEKTLARLEQEKFILDKADLEGQLPANLLSNTIGELESAQLVSQPLVKSNSAMRIAAMLLISILIGLAAFAAGQASIEPEVITVTKVEEKWLPATQDSEKPKAIIKVVTVKEVEYLDRVKYIDRVEYRDRIKYQDREVLVSAKVNSVTNCEAVQYWSSAHREWRELAAGDKLPIGTLLKGTHLKSNLTVAGRRLRLLNHQHIWADHNQLTRMPSQFARKRIKVAVQRNYPIGNAKELSRAVNELASQLGTGSAQERNLAQKELVRIKSTWEAKTGDSGLFSSRASDSAPTSVPGWRSWLKGHR